MFKSSVKRKGSNKSDKKSGFFVVCRASVTRGALVVRGEIQGVDVKGVRWNRRGSCGVGRSVGRSVRSSSAASGPGCGSGLLVGSSSAGLQGRGPCAQGPSRGRCIKSDHSGCGTTTERAAAVIFSPGSGFKKRPEIFDQGWRLDLVVGRGRLMMAWLSVDQGKAVIEG